MSVGACSCAWLFLIDCDIPVCLFLACPSIRTFSCVFKVFLSASKEYARLIAHWPNDAAQSELFKELCRSGRKEVIERSTSFGTKDCIVTSRVEYRSDVLGVAQARFSIVRRKTSFECADVNSTTSRHVVKSLEAVEKVEAVRAKVRRVTRRIGPRWLIRCLWIEARLAVSFLESCACDFSLCPRR